MGLDVTHDCWSGAYGSFNLWRNEVARAAGYRMIPELPGRPGREVYAIVLEPCWAYDNFMGKWTTDPPDPLLVLLVHSDCDGQIAKRHLLPLADRLDEIAPNLPTGDMYRDHRASAVRFGAGLRAAAAAGEKVLFR